MSDTCVNKELSSPALNTRANVRRRTLSEKFKASASSSELSVETTSHPILKEVQKLHQKKKILEERKKKVERNKSAFMHTWLRNQQVLSDTEESSQQTPLFKIHKTQSQVDIEPYIKQRHLSDNSILNSKIDMEQEILSDHDNGSQGGNKAEGSQGEQEHGNENVQQPTAQKIDEQNQVTSPESTTKSEQRLEKSSSTVPYQVSGE